MFEKILPKEMLPKAILRRIKGEYYDAKYNPIHYNDEWFATKKISTNRIFLKPAIDSSSGEGVMCFSRNDDGCYYTKTGQKFDEAFLQLYSTEHSDFIVQEGLTQSMYMAQFNPSSINTLRIATYRSVVDNTVHVVRIIMRIGRSGSEVDNAHAGGLFVGIGMNGTVGKYACDQYGNKFDSFNGVDFSNSTFAIPNFANILDFAKDIGARILHHRLIAQDIAIQRDGTPCLVEFNIRAFSTWLFQFTTGPALGEYANEIIEYCAKHKKDVNKVLVEPF